MQQFLNGRPGQRGKRVSHELGLPSVDRVLFLWSGPQRGPLTSGFLCIVLAAGSVGLCVAFFSSLETQVESEALELSVETVIYLRDQLEHATLPLLSLAQFVTEIDLFQNLASSGIESLPFLDVAAGENNTRSTRQRNLTDSACEDPETIDRYARVAETIKANVRMQDTLLLLELAPHGVVCMVHPRINEEDYKGNNHPLNITDLLGLDYSLIPCGGKENKSSVTRIN